MYTNQVTNPSFDTGGLTGWSSDKSGDITLGVSTAFPRSGGYSLQIWSGGRGNANSAAVLQAQSVYPSGTYQISFWYAQSAANSACTVSGTFTNQVGSPVYGYPGSAPAGNWIFVNGTITTSASFGSVAITGSCLITTSATNTMYFDDITFARLS